MSKYATLRVDIEGVDTAEVNRAVRVVDDMAEPHGAKLAGSLSFVIGGMTTRRLVYQGVDPLMGQVISRGAKSLERSDKGLKIGTALTAASLK
jgi:hypothetical protein